MSRAIVTLIQQSQQILDIVAPKVKEEADKKIAEIKQKIPTKDSVKQMMMDEVTSRGPELVCSIEVRNRIDFIYNKLKSTLDNLDSKLEKANEKLQDLLTKIAKITAILTIIEGIILFLKSLIPLLSVAINSAKIGLILLKGPAADGDTTIRLAELSNKSKAKIEEIKNSTKVFGKKVAKIAKVAAIPAGIITLAIGVISAVKLIINTIKLLVETFYARYILMCDVEGDSLEDEDFSNAMDSFSDPETGESNVDFSLIEEDLLPNTIERFKNANFQVIQYRIA